MIAAAGSAPAPVGMLLPSLPGAGIAPLPGAANPFALLLATVPPPASPVAAPAASAPDAAAPALPAIPPIDDAANLLRLVPTAAPPATQPADGDTGRPAPGARTALVTPEQAPAASGAVELASMPGAQAEAAATAQGPTVRVLPADDVGRSPMPAAPSDPAVPTPDAKPYRSPIRQTGASPPAPTQVVIATAATAPPVADQTTQSPERSLTAQDGTPPTPDRALPTPERSSSAGDLAPPPSDRATSALGQTPPAPDQSLAPRPTQFKPPVPSLQASTAPDPVPMLGERTAATRAASSHAHRPTSPLGPSAKVEAQPAEQAVPVRPEAASTLMPPVSRALGDASPSPAPAPPATGSARPATPLKSMEGIPPVPAAGIGTMPTHARPAATAAPTAPDATVERTAVPVDPAPLRPNGPAAEISSPSHSEPVADQGTTVPVIGDRANDGAPTAPARSSTRTVAEVEETMAPDASAPCVGPPPVRAPGTATTVEEPPAAPIAAGMRPIPIPNASAANAPMPRAIAPAGIALPDDRSPGEPAVDRETADRDPSMPKLLHDDGTAPADPLLSPSPPLPSAVLIPAPGMAPVPVTPPPVLPPAGAPVATNAPPVTAPRAAAAARVGNAPPTAKADAADGDFAGLMPTPAAGQDAPQPAPSAATPIAVTPSASATPIAATPTATPPDAIITAHLDVARDGQWLDTLARDIARTADRGGVLRFHLSPANLGSLHVAIAGSDDGAAIRLTTQTDDALRILQDAQPQLLAEARAQGLRISAAHVEFAPPDAAPPARPDVQPGSSPPPPASQTAGPPASGQGQQSGQTSSHSQPQSNGQPPSQQHQPQRQPAAVVNRNTASDASMADRPSADDASLYA